MARNGSGTYSLPAGNPVVTGTTISSTWANNTLTDIGTALTGSVAADGQTPITANIPMSGFKITGLGAGAVAGDAIRYEQFASPPAIGGTAPAAGAFTTLSATGVITSTVATGTAPFTVASTTEVANLNAATATTATTATSATTATTATTANALNNTAQLKIPATDCTQASGALTFTMGAAIYDFGDATLTSGTVTQVSGTPADLVLPSGGTLGTITTVEANIYRVVINNAGTLEQAIIQPLASTDLSEEGVISTTAIGTGSDSLGVFYSTTARTNVPYRIVGIVKSVNTAGAWGDPTLIRGSSGRVLLETRGGSYSTAVTSGSSVQVNGIPSYAKRIVVAGTSISTNGTADIRVQAGAGVTIETSTYSGATTFITTVVAWTTSCVIVGNTVAANSVHGQIVFEVRNIGSTSYSVSSGFSNGTAGNSNGSGVATFTAPIGCIRIVTTDTFDNASGNITVTWE